VPESGACAAKKSININGEGMKIYRINMGTLTFASEDVPEKWNMLGGRGLTSTIVAQEVKPTCHPLGRNNKLVFAPGLLSGTTAINSGRLSAGAKSPLTGTIKESNAGGTAAQFLSRLGIRALIIEGVPEKDTWYAIHVDKDGVTIQQDTELVGKWNYEVMKAVPQKCGENVSVLCIGPAGEMRMAAANISVRIRRQYPQALDFEGLGAVMGSKIKYITVNQKEDRYKFLPMPKSSTRLSYFCQGRPEAPGFGKR
jgi:aldehyde:ferredoxin oxidoreductase